MGTIYDCEQSELVEKASEELKKVNAIKAPSWAAFVKTGVHKERPPVEGDWWHTRAASVLRQIYRKGPIGVSKLRTAYGGKKNRGYKTEHFYKGSGSILRKILQQLEAAGFVKKEEKNVHKGRVLTAAGKKFLDNIAAQISIARPQQKKEAIKAEAKTESREAKSEARKTERKEAKSASEEKKKTEHREAKPKEEKQPAAKESQAKDNAASMIKDG
ncbi:30S ribosomal protein S19e [Candidatus Woesearchaeota archaeon]|nr:30S ribosomal protein S19e [Candidatus Woesearchaeota archaeon]